MKPASKHTGLPVLTEADVKFIRKHYRKTQGGRGMKSKYSLAALAAKYSVCIRTIQKVVKNQTWRTP